MQETCPQGHTFEKTSDCPTCPTCEAQRAPKTGFLAEIPAPARRALERQGITTLADLSGHTERDLLQLHGMGPSTIPKLKSALQAAGLTFRQP